MRAVIARICLAVLAVVVLAWLAVMERDARLVARGTKATLSAQVLHTPSAAAERDLRDATLLNPDTNPDLLRALLLATHGDWRGSERIALAVVRREPDNLQGWASVYSAANGRDPRTARVAVARIRRLNPLGASRH